MCVHVRSIKWQKYFVKLGHYITLFETHMVHTLLQLISSVFHLFSRCAHLPSPPHTPIGCPNLINFIYLSVDLSARVDGVKEENLKLKSENQVLGQYIENLMSASSVFQTTDTRNKRSKWKGPDFHNSPLYTTTIRGTHHYRTNPSRHDFLF